MTQADVAATGEVIVGVDGSDGSQRALEWAVAKQARFGSVKPVTTFQVGVFADGWGTADGADLRGEPYHADAERLAHQAVSAVDPTLTGREAVLDSRPGPGLVSMAEDADLLVVGTRGRSTLAEITLGSVGTYCVNHARVPVVIVPPDAVADAPLATIVVGVDGSDNATAALCWAIDHVDPGGTVQAVGAYSFVAVAADGYLPPLDLLEDETQKRVENTVEHVRRTGRDVESVEVVIRRGDPRIELQKVAADADLVVVGARGHRAVAHLLLGSVASALSHHVTIPTVVVPQP